MRGAGQPQRPAAAAGAAAGPRPADRDTRGRAAVYARGGRGAAPARGVGPARCVGGGAGGPDRGLGGRAAAGRTITAQAGRCRRFRGRVHRQPPVRPGLPGRRGARGAGRAAAGIPARDVGARPAQRLAVRRRHRPRGQPGAARGGRTGGLVPDPAGRGARLVALSPPIRRPAPRPPATRAARTPGAAAPQRRSLVPGARDGRRRHRPRGRGRGDALGGPDHRAALRPGPPHPGRGGHHRPLAVGPPRRRGQVPPPAAAGAGSRGRRQRPPRGHGTAAGRG